MQADKWLRRSVRDECSLFAPGYPRPIGRLARVGTDFRTEPVHALVRRFDGEFSVVLFAVEVGMEQKAFQTAIGKSSRLTELGFGQLLLDNGGMKRNSWGGRAGGQGSTPQKGGERGMKRNALGDYFGKLAKMLGLGDNQKPTPIEAAARPVEPDRSAEANPGRATVAESERINPKDGAVMVYIPPGEFLMGDDDLENNPRHRVKLSGYWIYKNLVTVKQYKLFCAANGNQMPDPPDFDADWAKENHPMVNVSWDDAVEYCRWAGVSLPSEAQWERAARGTDGRKYPWGNEFDASKLWCSKDKDGDAGGTAPVGEYIHLFGLSDMAGNVWQWCADTYDENFWKGRASETPNPVNGAPGEERVLRGGPWGYGYPFLFRAAFRYCYEPDTSGKILGFRAASRASK